MFKDSRQVLAMARAQGRLSVVLLVAAESGQTERVAREALLHGGTIRYRADDVDYLRIRIPIDQATVLAESDGIESVAADVDDTYPTRLSAGGRLLGAGHRQDTVRRRVVGDTTKWPPKWSDYPLRNPYTPLADIDAARFRKEHPTWDGRGVTIALLDGNLDMLLPEFQTAYDLNGRRVPKIADYLNVTDPIDDADQMPQWVDMEATVTASNRRLDFQGKTYTTPRDGSFRIGIFSERRFNNPGNAAYLDQDIDRNGNPRGDDGQFAVLWDESTNDVWVDTDRNLSFASEKAMTDYAKRPEFGVFGRDNPTTIMREAIGFAIQTDAAHRKVSVNVGIYQHATEIMGSVVGNREPHGHLEGVAPGAQVVSMFWGGIAHAMIEGMIAAFRHPKVDLVVLEQSVAIASVPYLLADAHHPISLVAERLIRKYKKLLFVPGDNMPAFGFVAEDGLAPSAISVGGYQSADSYRMNMGLIVDGHDHLHWGALSHGPSGTGALKPDLLAPSGQMSTDIGYLFRTWEQTLRGLYQLPSGYSVDGGTSTATPMAAGAAALVLSAAKQTGLKVDAHRLKLALTGSARFIDRLAAHEQGNGLIQVGAAYALLKSLQSAEPVTIVSRAPIRTVLAPLVHVPNEGVGIYEREGWSLGDRGTRAIRLTRTSGPTAPMTFKVTWQGNRGAFSSPATVTLPLSREVELPVEIAPKAYGAHSAILTLDHESIPGHAYRVLNTVVIPMRLGAENGYTDSVDLMVPRPGDAPAFVLVPPGAQALAFSAATEDTSMRIAAVAPSKDFRFGTCDYSAPPTSPCVIPRPEPGVWEINASVTFGLRNYDPNRASPVKPVKATVRARVYGASVSPDPSRTLGNGGSSGDFGVMVTNNLAAIAGASLGAEVVSVRRTTRTIGQGEQQIFEVAVPPGAGFLRAAVSNPSDAGADLDLYLLDCSMTPPPSLPPPPAEKDSGNKAPAIPPPNCAPRDKEASVGPGGEVTVRKPAPGRWLVVVDAFRVPGGSTTYTYLDAIADPRLGAVAIADSAADRPVGARWTALGHVWITRTPTSPRGAEAWVAVMGGELRSGAGFDIFRWQPMSGGGRSIPIGAAEIDLAVLKAAQP